jgi:beta-lactamase regulating signal transducer with metallopeptidase domain
MTALVEWLWQGLVLVVIASLALRVSAKLDAASRYAIWWVVVFSVLALPWIPSIEPATPGLAAGPLASGSAAVPPVSFPAPPDWALSIVVGAWIGWVILGFVRLAQGVACAARVRRDSVEVTGDRQARLRIWAATQPLGRPVSLRHSRAVRTACAVGGRRPAIVLPSSWLDALDDATLDQIVLHERAHLARFDDVARVVEAVIDSVGGWHPAVRLALARMDVEREAACDDRVVLRTGETRRYAHCLADAAAAMGRPAFEPVLVSRVFGRVSALQVRVTRLLDTRCRRRARLRPVAVGTGMVLMTVSVVAAGQLDPLVVFEHARAAALVAPAVDAVSAPTPMASRPASNPVDTTGRSFGPSRRIASRGAGMARTGPPADRGPSRAAAPVEPAEAPLLTSGEQPAATLASRSFDVPIQAPAALDGRAPVAVDDTRRSPWTAAAQGGVALGNATGRGGVALATGSRKTGTAIGGFFARAGRAIGKSF